MSVTKDPANQLLGTVVAVQANYYQVRLDANQVLTPTDEANQLQKILVWDIFCCVLAGRGSKKLVSR